MKRLIAAFVFASAVAAAGCSTSADDTSSTLPTLPSSPLVTEPFSGTVQVGSNDSHTFNVTSSGFAITVDMTSAGPPSTISMGIGVGSLVGGTCQLSTSGFTTAPASATPQLSGTIASGQFCLMIYDVGNLSAPVTYTAVVTHY